MPVCLEVGVECTYPVAEATSAGLQWMAGYAVVYLKQLIVLIQMSIVASSIHCKWFKPCNERSCWNLSPFVGSSILCGVV